MRSPGLLCSFLSLALSGAAFAQTTACQEAVPRGNPGDQLGCSVATDGATSVFGANMGNGGRGSVTIEEVSQPIVPADAAPGDQFGFASAIRGNTLIVGAPTADVQGLRDAGAVYVFRQNNGQWVQQAKLSASEASAGAQFGFSVAFDGETLAVGAPRDGARGSLAGAVYLFQPTAGGGWSQQAKLTAARTRPFDEFGYAVALDGATLAVGAPFADGRAGGNQGAVYVFERQGGGWTEGDTLAGASAAAGDELGVAVALDGGTLAAGARRADVGGAVDAGAVYVFEREGRAWGERARLTAPGGGARDLFGGAVALSGARLAAGASQANNGAGLAYLFEKNGAGAWRFRETLRPAANGRFGYSIAMSGNTLVIGAFLARNGAGSAVLCEIDLPPPPADLELTFTAPASARPGDRITYTLTVTNSGPVTATGVVLKEPIPAGLQPVGASLPANCTAQDGTISCSLGDVAPGASAGVKIDWTVLSSCADSIASTATASAANAPAVQSTASTALLLTADLRVTNTAPVTTARGDELPYSLAVTNLGPHCARGVVLTVPIPAGLVPLLLPSGCAVTAAGVRCPLGDLRPLEERSLAVSFRVTPDAAGTITNTAAVSARSTDPQPANSSATARTAVTFAAVRASCQEISGARLAGGTVTYTFLVSNAGLDIQKDNPGDELTDTLPAALTLVSATASSGTAATQGNTVTWNGSIPAGGLVTITVTAAISPATAGTAICNQASIAFDADGNGTNESSGLSDDPGLPGTADPCCFLVPFPNAIPALSVPGLLALVLLLAALGLLRLRRRPAP